MSYLPFTLLAYFLNAVSVLVAKFLLNKSIPDPLIYIFFISVFSLLALLLLPFTNILPWWVFLLASISTILWTAGAYYMFLALKIGLASRVIPVIGTLIPVFLVIYSNITGSISLTESWAVVILVLGLIFLTLPYLRGELKLKEVIFEVLAALLFAGSYILLRDAYTLANDFFSVFIWSRMILIPIGMLILVVPMFRRRVFNAQGMRVNFLSKAGILFLFGQLAGGVSELLLVFSISLANPALVNSLQGTQYVFLLLFSILLAKKFPLIFKERFLVLDIIGKVVGILLIILGLYLLAGISMKNNSKIIYGTTYSPKYATELGLDPKITYTRMLDELKVKTVRLPLYWDEIEKNSGEYDFTEAMFYLAEAEKREVDIILVVGFKTPRWPECHIPEWARQLSQPEFEQKVVDLVKGEVYQYQGFKNIKTWQVENESLLPFGRCPKITQATYQLLQKEVEIVRQLDNRPVTLTDSGELSFWYRSVKLADWFGISVYRAVWSPWFGHVQYPIPPFYYNLKAKLVNLLTGFKVDRFIVSELQMEPWLPTPVPLQEAEVDYQRKFFTVKDFQSNLSYTKEIGFNEVILWGVEWWYFMEQKGHSEYLEEAKKSFQQTDE